MTINWDTAVNPYKYPGKVKKVFYNQYILQRKKYTQWIGKISKKYDNSVDWWSTNTITRNPYISNAYKTICIIETIKSLKKKNDSFNIIVDSIELKKILKNFFKKSKQKNNIFVKKKPKKLIDFFIFFKSILFQTIIFIMINLFIKKKKIGNKITLVNTYPTLDSLFPERLYKFQDHLIKKNKVTFYFVPTFIITKKIYQLWKIIKILENENYIFKEHYLSLNNFMNSIFHFYRAKKFANKFKKYNNYDLSILINKELNSLSNYSSRMACISNYYFFLNLKLKKIELKKSVSWLENQPDKLWNFGVNKFYPEVLSIGYQGFNNIPQLMNSIPAKYEKKANLLPKKVVTIGKAYIKSRKEFYNKLNIKVGPALVYQDILKKRKNNNRKKIKFLAVLSDFQDINQSIIELLINNKNLFKDIGLTIKLPKNPSKFNLKIKKLLPSNFILTNENLADLMSKSENVICAEITSSILESIIHNCYLIIPNVNIPNEYFLRRLGIPQNRFTTISNNFEFIQKIKLLKKKKHQLSYPKNLIKNLFNKVTKKNIKLFF